MRDNTRKIRDFFFKIRDFFKKSVIFFKNLFWSSKCFLPSPCLRTSSIPPWETLKCLLQTLQYACWLPQSLAITKSNVLVYSALKFDPLPYSIRFFAGLIPGDDSRFAIFVGFIELYSRLDYLYLYYLVDLQALNWYRFFSDFEMLYLTAIRNYQASLWYQYWFHSCETWQYQVLASCLFDNDIDFSRRLPPNYHKKWLLTKKKKW